MRGLSLPYLALRSDRLSALRAGSSDDLSAHLVQRRQRRLLNQFDLVAVRILDECDIGTTELHWPRLAHDLNALLLQFVAGLVEILAADCQMTERITHLVIRLAPVVRQFDHGVAALIAVADEREGELAVGKIVLADQL